MAAHGTYSSYANEDCRCDDCKAAGATYRADHKDEMAAYRASHKAEQVVYSAAHYAAHRDELRDRRAAYYAAHREECAAYQRAYSAQHRDEVAARNAARQQSHARWMKVIREAQGCRDCGTHGGRLLHHHLDPSTKVCEVSRMTNYSLESILDEIAKCTVLCEPCHHEVHGAMRAEAAR